MIELRDCRKRYPGQNGQGPVLALDGIDLRIAPQEFVCLLCPAGGKTTLPAVAGLIALDEGEIIIDAVVTGRGLSGDGVSALCVLPADVSSTWLWVRAARRAQREREQIARELVVAVGLGGFERHHPRQLSGGMQQRVGLARALAVDPQILLMDEPFGSVDEQTRRLLQEDLLALLERTPKTVLFVTHSMEEAVRLGDRVILMSPRPGRVARDIAVGLPRPRGDDLEQQPRFAELKEELWRHLRQMYD